WATHRGDALVVDQARDFAHRAIPAVVDDLLARALGGAARSDVPGRVVVELLPAGDGVAFATFDALDQPGARAATGILAVADGRHRAAVAPAREAQRSSVAVVFESGRHPFCHEARRRRAARSGHRQLDRAAF